MSKKYFWREHLCALPSALVCAHLTTCVHAHSLEGSWEQHQYYWVLLVFGVCN